MTHASRVLAQLKEAERDEETPEEIKDRLRERAEEIRETLVTPVVRLSCSQCGGHSLIPFEEPEPDVVGRGWKCPHCPLGGEGMEHEIRPDEVKEVALLRQPPDMVDTIDPIERYDRANGYGGPERWAAYREVVVKGRVGAEVARERGVTPGTVYSHVSRAKDAIVEATT